METIGQKHINLCHTPNDVEMDSFIYDPFDPFLEELNAQSGAFYKEIGEIKRGERGDIMEEEESLRVAMMCITMFFVTITICVTILEVAKVLGG